MLLGKVVVRLPAVRGHGGFEENAQRGSHPAAAFAGGQVQAAGDLQGQRGGQDAVLAEEIYLDLHLVAQEAGDVDVVPGLFIIAARLVVVDPHHVVLHRVPQAIGEHVALGVDLVLQALRLAQGLPVAVAEQVGAEPAFHVQGAGAQGGGQHGLEVGLPGFTVLAGYGHVPGGGQLAQGGHVGRHAGGKVPVGRTLLDAGVGVQHGGADGRVVRVQPGLEGGGGLIYGGRQVERALRTGQVDDHDATVDRGREIPELPLDEGHQVAVAVGAVLPVHHPFTVIMVRDGR